MWARLAVARDALAGTEHDRQAKCLHTRIAAPGQGVALHRSADGRTWVGGVARCGHWTCPACGVARAREAAGQLGAVIARHLAELHHDAWMLTLTVPHYEADRVVDVVDGLYRASQAFFRSRTWRKFKAKWDIVGVVRAIDVTFKAPGYAAHPHFHIALLPRRAAASLWQPIRGMERDDRLRYLADVCATELSDAWTAAVLAVGFRPRSIETLRTIGAQLQPGDKVSNYLSGWGLDDETTGAPLKRRSHLGLLDDGTDLARYMYWLWRVAVDGRQWLTGLTDAMSAVGVDDGDVAAHVAALAPPPPPPVAPVTLPIPAYSWGAVLRVGLGELLRVVAVAATESEARDRVWALLNATDTGPDDVPPPSDIDIRGRQRELI